MVKIPSLKNGRAEPLRRCIEKTAAESGFSQGEVTWIMTFFLTAIADEVTKGRAVSIPGFGLFAQTRLHSFARGTTWRPWFIPANAFRQQVRLGTRPDEDVRKQTLGYSRNNARGTDPGTRPASALALLRATVSKQLGRT